VGGRSRARWWCGLAFVGLGCGPEVVASSDDGTTTAGSQTATSSMEATADPSADSTTGIGEDAELCVQWCLNAEARGCAEGYHDEACYSRCLTALETSAASECGAEYRDVRACEAQAGPPAEPTCESVECRDAYVRHDLCIGYCTHLDGYPGSSGSPTSCEWRSTCYGYELEIACPVGDAAGLCTCTVDEEVIAECEVGIELAPLDCEQAEFHVLTSCCAEAFAGVLLP